MPIFTGEWTHLTAKRAGHDKKAVQLVSKLVEPEITFGLQWSDRFLIVGWPSSSMSRNTTGHTYSLVMHEVLAVGTAVVLSL